MLIASFDVFIFLPLWLVIIKTVLFWCLYYNTRPETLSQ